MPLIVENASKRFGNQWAYRDVSFDVADGEVFGIFGPNGSGKSALIESLGGVGAAQKGSLIDRLLGRGDDGVDVAQAIERADAKLLVHDPFRGQDNAGRERVKTAIRAAASGKKIPVVITSSSFVDILACCDCAALLADGYLQQTGTPQELYEEPSSRTAARLTGKCNLIEARRLTSSRAEMPEFQTIDGGHRVFTQKLELRELGAINQNASLSIRPEQVVISFGASFPEDNLLRGRVVNSDFRGPITYVHLDCEGLALTAMVTKLIGLSAGDECMVGLPPDRLRVLAS